MSGQAAPSKFTKSQIKKLGSRLRLPGTLSDSDTILLNQWIAEHEAAVEAVLQRLNSISIGGDLSLRFKNTDTIGEKLRREQSSLANIRDIAGLRIVGDWTRSEQLALVARLKDALLDCEEIDRIKDPRSGYRARHLEVRVDGFRVEIQVRTVLQHEWAQVFEMVADRIGRQIRYGFPPPTPDAVVGGGITQGTLVQVLLFLADQVSQLEEMIDENHSREAAIRASPAWRNPLRRIRLRREQEAARHRADRTRRAVLDRLQEIRKSLAG